MEAPDSSANQPSPFSLFSIKPVEESAPKQPVRVGIVGCGMVTQVVHIPTLNSLSDYFKVTYLYDVSQDAINHCRLKIAGATRPQTTREISEICTSPEVDLVLIASHHAFHASHALLALRAHKHVFIEKPIALSLRDTDLIIDADKAAGGSKVFVGYMRRYAAAFLDTVKEIESIGQIRYARVRDIIGPNSTFISQSCAFPKAFDDYHQDDTEELREKQCSDIKQALEIELGIPVTSETDTMWQMLSILGTHDLSAMREALGMPTGVIGAAPCALTGPPFWSAMFQYPGFVVAYESGVDQVPRFDASIEIFGTAKTVKMCIDTPFIRGLPTTMVTKEALPDGSYREATTRRTYEDPFTLEWKEVHHWVSTRKPPKTSAVDARKDLQVLGMFMKAMTSSRIAQ